MIGAIILFNEEKSHNSEMARFICISGIALLPLIAFFLTDFEFGVNSIVGLISQNQLDANGKIMLDINGQPVRQWMINFGGDAITNYRSGIQIPFYVIAFGLIGGYLRYLTKTFRRGGDTGIPHQKVLFDERKETLNRKAELRKEFVNAKGSPISDEQLEKNQRKFFIAYKRRNSNVKH